MQAIKHNLASQPGVFNRPLVAGAEQSCHSLVLYVKVVNITNLIHQREDLLQTMV